MEKDQKAPPYITGRKFVLYKFQTKAVSPKHTEKIIYFSHLSKVSDAERCIFSKKQTNKQTWKGI